MLKIKQFSFCIFAKKICKFFFCPNSICFKWKEVGRIYISSRGVSSSSLNEMSTPLVRVSSGRASSLSLVGHLEVNYAPSLCSNVWYVALRIRINRQLFSAPKPKLNLNLNLNHRWIAFSAFVNPFNGPNQ